jgi:hypothetical protein
MLSNDGPRGSQSNPRKLYRCGGKVVVREVAESIRGLGRATLRRGGFQSVRRFVESRRVTPCSPEISTNANPSSSLTIRPGIPWLATEVRIPASARLTPEPFFSRITGSPGNRRRELSGSGVVRQVDLRRGAASKRRDDVIVAACNTAARHAERFRLSKRRAATNGLFGLFSRAELRGDFAQQTAKKRVRQGRLGA